jgi:DNA-directed RNA polymerase subunit RPC12/RpoP
MSSKEKKEYRCEQCGINFDSLEAFTQHDKEKHIE